ncbi:MAG TPA: YidB family protein [Candidatus Binatia bacterium]|nr:YidB family protein [Candidatus Binatia bacterium]
MGLLDQFTKALGDKVSGGEGQNPLVETIFGMVNNPETGGLTGMVENFKSKGLGGVVASWISTGQNQPISSEQIQRVLGGDRIEWIAEKIGASKEDVAGGLASLLPEIVDKLTPDGKIPEGGLLQQGLSMLRGKSA